MPLYGGIDLHAHNSVVVLRNENVMGRRCDTLKKNSKLQKRGAQSAPLQFETNLQNLA